MSIKIHTAMILAAGLGTRMRPLTNERPKTLIPLNGKPIFDHICDRLIESGIEKIVVNGSYKVDRLEEHLNTHSYKHFILSKEEELLETGGGILKALPYLGDNPFFAINGDEYWSNHNFCTLSKLTSIWDDQKMDALLLIHPVKTSYFYDGSGDFNLTPEGQLIRRSEKTKADFVFTGIQILSPRLFKGNLPKKFSLNLLYDKALENNKLYGLVHQGEWFHLSKPENITATENILKTQKQSKRMA